MRTSILVGAVLALFLGAEPAMAADASCKKANARQEHTFKDFVPVEEVGLVTWRAAMDVRALDRCNHGALTVTYSWQNGRIEDTGGVLKITSIAYKTSSSSSWRVAGLTQGACASSPRRGCIQIKAGSHVDLSPKTRITHVRLTTALVYDPNPEDDNRADSKAFGPRSWTCDVRYPTCKKPTKKKTTTKKKPTTTRPDNVVPDSGPTQPSVNGGSDPAPSQTFDPAPGIVSMSP
jgi:hypothetical protein